MITWRPIAELPDELKDGREVLLWEERSSWVGVWNPETSSGSAWGWTDAREDGVRLEPTHFAEINAPEGASNG